MAKKNRFKVTVEESFGYGRLEGQKEALSEVAELIKTGMNEKALKIYIKARIKSLIETKNLGVK